MIDNKSNHFSILINKQLKIIEEIHSHLFKTEALINLGIQTNFAELGKSTTYEYLSILKNFVSLAIKDTENLGQLFDTTQLSHTT